MTEEIVAELNRMASEGESTADILEYISETCTKEEKEHIRYVWAQGSPYMAPAVQVAASLL